MVRQQEDRGSQKKTQSVSLSRDVWSEPVSEHHNIYLLFLELLRKVEITEVAEYLCDHFRR